METKTILTEVKLIDDRTFAGLASVTGNLDLGNDRIARGAFKKTLRERKAKIRHLWQHDFTAPPVAVITELDEVGEDQLPGSLKKRYPEATGGLRVVRTYLETARGDEVLAGVKSGAINEMSIGFDAIKVDWEDEELENGKVMRTRILRELRLYDTSDVNWGMNEATVAVAKIAEQLGEPLDPRVTQFLYHALIVKQADELTVPVSDRVLEAIDQIVTTLSNTADPPEQEKEDPFDAEAVTAVLMQRLAVAERQAVMLGG